MGRLQLTVSDIIRNTDTVNDIKMKFFTAISGLAVVSAQVPFQFPTRTDDAPAFFTHANGAGVFGDVRFDLIMDHGCHCRKLAHFNEAGHGGDPVDELDKRCQTFFSNRLCLKATGGACHPWSPTGPYGMPSNDRLTYTVFLKITGPLVNGVPTSLGFFDNAGQHCSQETDSCLKQICETDYESIAGLMNDSLGHASHPFVTDNSSCGVSGPRSGAATGRHCEGVAPDQKWVKN